MNINAAEQIYDQIYQLWAEENNMDVSDAETRVKYARLLNEGDPNLIHVHEHLKKRLKTPLVKMRRVVANDVFGPDTQYFEKIELPYVPVANNLIKSSPDVIDLTKDDDEPNEEERDDDVEEEERDDEPVEEHLQLAQDEPPTKMQAISSGDMEEQDPIDDIDAQTLDLIDQKLEDPEVSDEDKLRLYEVLKEYQYNAKQKVKDDLKQEYKNKYKSAKAYIKDSPYKYNIKSIKKNMKAAKKKIKKAAKRDRKFVKRINREYKKSKEYTYKYQPKPYGWYRDFGYGSRDEAVDELRRSLPFNVAFKKFSNRIKHRVAKRYEYKQLLSYYLMTQNRFKFDRLKNFLLNNNYYKKYFSYLKNY